MNIETFLTNKNIKDTKLALLSDIHYSRKFNLKIFPKLTKQLLNIRPDYICIVGDLVDNAHYKELKPLLNWLDDISDIAPTIIVFGNHELKRGYMHKWIEEQSPYLRKEISKLNNVYLLENKTISFNNISFYGYNPSFKHYEIKDESYETYLKEVDNMTPNYKDNQYNIFLSHSPLNIYKFISNNKDHPISKSDLILSGHTHNGCIPYTITNFLNKYLHTTRSLISPVRKLFGKYYQGRVTTPVNGYIYEGITKFSYSTSLFRIFNLFYHKKIQTIIIKKDTELK